MTTGALQARQLLEICMKIHATGDSRLRRYYRLFLRRQRTRLVKNRPAAPKAE
jgi:hypothetical protein